MKYKVKLSFPTIVKIGEADYTLFPGKIIELPEAEILNTYLRLGYLELAEEDKKRKNAKEVENAS